MTRLQTSLLLLVAVIGPLAPASAQARYLVPDRIERATVVDDDGLHQWAEWPEPKCASCKGTGKAPCQTCARFAKDAKVCPECKRAEKLLAPCRACAGSGKIADPLQRVPCAGCMGAGFLLCTVCGGGARLRVGSAKRWSVCPACRGTGGFPCAGCNGERWMPALAIKPSLAEAPFDKLLKAEKDLDKAIQAFAAFTPAGGAKTRKSVKELGKAYGYLKKYSPGFKALPKCTKNYMSKILAGAQFQGHEENEANTLGRLKSNAEYYLRHQKRMLELAKKRADLNIRASGK
ncbi:MAG TPA: hypothetical protein ENI87_00165 [bacterium]|nr:hypothetical protein [bacterium]